MDTSHTPPKRFTNSKELIKIWRRKEKAGRSKRLKSERRRTVHHGMYRALPVVSSVYQRYLLKDSIFWVINGVLPVSHHFHRSVCQISKYHERSCCFLKPRGSAASKVAFCSLLTWGATRCDLFPLSPPIISPGIHKTALPPYHSVLRYIWCVAKRPGQCINTFLLL